MSGTSRKQLNRVYVPEDVGDHYNLLTAEGKRHETADPLQVPFFKYKDVFLLAACAGFHAKQRKTLPTGDKKREIRLDTFDRNEIDILKAIAIADVGDVQILDDMGEVLIIVEEYAYAGILELEAQILNANGHPLWNAIATARPAFTN